MKSSTRWTWESLGIRVAFLSACAGVGLTWGIQVDASTDVSGTIASSTWTEAGSPYRVTGDVTIPAGVTLTVEPGVVITLDAGVGMTVRGQLTAIGTSDKAITIDATDAQQPWAGLLFTGAAASGRLEHVEVGHASRAKGGATAFSGGINNEGGSKLHIQSCRFHDFMTPCLENNTKGEMTVLDTLIEDTMEAIHSNGSFARIERCHIRNIHGYSDCVDFDDDSTPLSIIKDCLLENGDDDGIDLSTNNAIVSNVTIHRMACKGLSFDGLNGTSSPKLSWIGITDCMNGVVSENSCNPVLSHVTVTRCDIGVRFFEKNVGSGGGKGSLESSIIWGNTISVDLDALSTISLTFSDVEGGYPGTGNIDVDPLFLDAPGNDFRLKPGSQALGTGKNGEDMGAFPAAPPGGAFIRGDANSDGGVDISDAVSALFHLFGGGSSTTPCLDALDADDDGTIDISDAIYLLSSLFQDGPAPRPPFPEPGTDPTTGDPYGCDSP